MSLQPSLDDVALSAVESRAPDGESLKALAQTLETLAFRYEAERDRRCVFTLAYALMTRQLAQSFGTTPDVDWPWIARLADSFGTRYLDALRAADAGAPQSPAWAHAFGTQKAERTSVVEDLLFPLAVHIIRDLPHALCDAGLESDGRAHLHEFHFVNEVMEGTIEAVQDVIAVRYGPFTKYLDVFAGNYDEILTNYGFRVSRSVAWYNANRLLDARSRDEAVRSIERSPRILMESVMSPPLMSLRIVTRVLRLLSSLLRRWPTAGEPIRPPARSRVS